MEKSIEFSSTVMFSKDSLEKVKIDMKADEFDNLFDIEEEKNKKEPPFKRTTLQIVLTYTMCFLISFLIGFNFTSYGLVVEYGLKNYSAGFFDEHHKLFRHLCPAVLYLGSTIGTLAMLMKRQYSHLNVIRLGVFLFFIGYIIQIDYPHILVIFFSRFLIGIGSGICCLVTPQVLYFGAREGIKGLLTSFYPFFILVGITSAVALKSLATPETNFMLSLIPLFAIGTAFLCSFWTFELQDVQKEKGFFEVTKFMFQSTAVKSTVSVILTRVFQRATGVDFIRNFASVLFTGEYAQIKSLSPLITAAVFILLTGCLPDLLGRKLPIIASLSLIGMATLAMGIYGTNVWGLIIFNIVYAGGLGTIPCYYQNEAAPKNYLFAINEISTLSNVILGLIVALYAAFLLSPSNTTIWYTFSGFSLLGAIIMGITMPETQGTPIEERGFIKNWFNPSFKNKNLN